MRPHFAKVFALIVICTDLAAPLARCDDDSQSSAPTIELVKPKDKDSYEASTKETKKTFLVEGILKDTDTTWTPSTVKVKISGDKEGKVEYYSHGEKPQRNKDRLGFHFNPPVPSKPGKYFVTITAMGFVEKPDSSGDSKRQIVRTKPVQTTVIVTK